MSFNIYDVNGNGIELSPSYAEIYQQYSGKLKTYRGSFPSDANAKSASAYNVGDWWVFNGESKSINCATVFNGDIIFVRSTTINTLNGTAAGNIYDSIRVQKPCYTKKAKKYDVVIIGAGAGGVGCAYAMKDSGLRVALIERQDTLGGTHCSNVGLLIANPVGNWFKTICETAYNDGYLDLRSVSSVPYKEVGSGTTFEKRWRANLFSDPKNVINGYSGNHVNINGVYMANKYKADLEETIDIFTNHEVVAAKSDNGVLYEIETIDRESGKKEVFCADFFVDCSADAVLATKNASLTAQTDYYSGTDGYARFQETVYQQSDTPSIYDINTVEATMTTYGHSISTGLESLDVIKYKNYPEITQQKPNFVWSPPKGGISITSASDSTKMSGEDFLTKSMAWNEADGYERVKCLFYKVSPYKGGNRFTGTPKMLAIRESWRYATDVAFDQSKLAIQITSANIATNKTMALSTWYTDFHNSNITATSNIANGIPYEAMIPTCYNNVLVASRCYGASHLALASARLVKCMLDLGYSAGKAMIQCVNEGLSDVRNVDTADVQTETGILDTIATIEQYFYGSTVDYVEVQ